MSEAKRLILIEAAKRKAVAAKLRKEILLESAYRQAVKAQGASK